MRNDLYPFSVTPRDLAPRDRAVQTLAAPSKGIVFGRAAPSVHDATALIPSSRQQIPPASPPTVGGETAPG
jgi:hypothetical protein